MKLCDYYGKTCEELEEIRDGRLTLYVCEECAQEIADCIEEEARQLHLATAFVWTCATAYLTVMAYLLGGLISHHISIWDFVR